MKIQESAENYLETILMISLKKGNVRSIDIATEMGFSKPSVSNAVKMLRENGYLLVDEGGLIKLTDSGMEIAKSMYDRHQFFTEFLIRLGVNEDTAREDACRIEHALSQESFEKIKAYVEAQA